MEFQFFKVDDSRKLEPLKTAWRKSLTAPQDGMWEALTDNAAHWQIEAEGKMIGFACVNEESCLLQFYLLPEWVSEGGAAFQQFIQENNIDKGLVATNNPLCLSLALHAQRGVTVHTLLFTDYLKSAPGDGIGQLIKADQEDVERVVEFFHTSLGAPKEWLTMYTEGLIERKELFMLIEQNEIIGTCEVRKSGTNTDVADIGMVVSPDHRKKGIGTYLLGRAKEIAMEHGRSPICSCEVENIGSLKSIQKNGFRSIHQMLMMKF